MKRISFLCRILTILIVLAMFVSMTLLAGCGEEESSSTDSNGSKNSSSDGSSQDTAEATNDSALIDESNNGPNPSGPQDSNTKSNPGSTDKVSNSSSTKTNSSNTKSNTTTKTNTTTKEHFPNSAPPVLNSRLEVINYILKKIDEKEVYLGVLVSDPKYLISTEEFLCLTNVVGAVTLQNKDEFARSYEIPQGATDVMYLTIYAYHYDYIYAYKNKNTSKLDSDQKKVYNKAIEILDKCIKPGMTDYQKALEIHNYICTNFNTTTERMHVNPTSYQIYEMFFTGKGGYEMHTACYDLLLNMLGIHSKYVLGENRFGDYVWNIIKLGNEWYFVDVFADNADPDSMFVDVMYQYFCVPESVMAEKLTWLKDIYPKCTSTKYLPTNNVDKPTYS